MAELRTNELPLVNAAPAPLASASEPSLVWPLPPVLPPRRLLLTKLTCVPVSLALSANRPPPIAKPPRCEP